MNFDINMLSTLMQMLGSQKSQPEPKSNAREDYSVNNDKNQTASVFAMQNGLGQKVSFGEAEPKTQQSAPKSNNPLSAMLEMMTGNSSNANGDFMSSLMPMFLNMMSGQKNATAQSAQQKDTGKKTEATPNAKPQNSKDSTENTANRNMKTQPHSQDKYEPIAFAGYALISTLNKLYVAKCLKH